MWLGPFDTQIVIRYFQQPCSPNLSNNIAKSNPLQQPQI